MKRRLIKIIFMMILYLSVYDVFLQSKESGLDLYLKKLREKGNGSGKNSKNKGSTQRTDPDLCERYPKLPSCGRFIANPENERSATEK